MKTLFTAVLLLLLPALAQPAELIREFRGDKNATTASFEVTGPWTLDWRLDGDFDSLIALDITLIDARTGRHVGKVLDRQRTKGNGLKLFHEPGRYQLRISTTLGRWRVKIEQIDAADLDRYTERKPPSLLDDI
ncbi:MAG: hypothetical protein AAF660_12745 [Pseudomonadota bacterium]